MPQLSPMSWVMVFIGFFLFFMLLVVSVWWGSVGEYGVFVKGLVKKVSVPLSWSFSSRNMVGFVKTKKGKGLSKG